MIIMQNNEQDRFESAELVLYSEHGETITLSLTKMQIFTVFKILGIQVDGDYYTNYSDDTLQQFYNYTGNPLKLVEREL